MHVGLTPVQLPLSLLSPWQFFCSVRTLSNALETALTAAALSRWPFAVGEKSAGGVVPASDRGRA
jgi:Alg9-like mannosyltransferase family